MSQQVRRPQDRFSNPQNCRFDFNIEMVPVLSGASQKRGLNSQGGVGKPVIVISGATI